jgi:hypothetical protein
MCCHYYCSAAAAATATPVLPPLLLSSGSMGVAVCRCRGGDVAATVDFVFVLFLFLFLLHHTNGAMVSHLFPATDIGVTALSVTTAVVLGAIVLQVETKMTPTTTTMTTMNEKHYGVPSTLPSNPCPKEGEGKGNEDKGGGFCCGRWW